MKISTLFSLSLMLLILSCSKPACSQINSVPIRSGFNNTMGEGFMYALPLNVVKVDVYVAKTDKYKGKYSDFASKLLGITDIVRSDVTSYAISRVEITTTTEVDTNHVYYVSLPQKLKDGKRIMVNLNQKGLISSFYATNEEGNEKVKNQGTGTPFRDLMKPILIEKVDTIIRKVSIDTTIIEEKILKRSITEKSNEQQAREIADLIYRIEDNKFSLVTGYQEVNYSKESMQFMLDRLNLMEREYLAFFKGSTVTTELKYTYYYTPSSNDDLSMMTLMRFSEAEGVMSKTSYYGESVSVHVDAINQMNEIRNFENKRLQSKSKSRGLYYRIPVEAMVSVKISDRSLASSKSFVSQLGILTFLPSNNISSADFHENGSLRSLTIE